VTGGSVTVSVTGAEAPPRLNGPPGIRARNSLVPAFPNVQPNWNDASECTIRTSTLCQSPSAPSFWRYTTWPDLSGVTVPVNVTWPPTVELGELEASVTRSRTPSNSAAV
jgi:hypothetical protein